MPVKCHIGDAVVVNKRPSNDEAVEKLVRMEKYVHFAREEALGYSGRQNNVDLTLVKILQEPECVEHCARNVEEAHEDEPAKGGFID